MINFGRRDQTLPKKTFICFHQIFDRLFLIRSQKEKNVRRVNRAVKVTVVWSECSVFTEQFCWCQDCVRSENVGGNKVEFGGRKQKGSVWS